MSRGKLSDIDPNVFLIYNNKLYVYSNPKSGRVFMADVATRATAADNNWWDLRYATLTTSSWIGASEVWRMLLRSKSMISGIEKALNDPKLKKKANRLDQSLKEYNPEGQDPDWWTNITMTSDYFSQLQQDDIVLSSAHDAILANDKISSYDNLGAALDDFYLKVNACLLNNGKLVESVSVKVSTKKSGSEVSNWRVFCIAKILKLYPTFSPTMFPKLSSPTELKVAPGNYIMWAENPQTGSKSTEQEFPIDSDEECDLTVP